MSGASLNIKECGRELEVWRILSDVQCGLNYEKDRAHVCVHVIIKRLIPMTFQRYKNGKVKARGSWMKN